MSTATTQARAGRILMTLAAMISGFISPFADFNATHAVNPLWPAHARFHVVWQVIITFCLAVLSLYLLWAKSVERVFATRISFLLSLTVMGGFIFDSFVTGLYGGSIRASDERSAVPFGWDGNLTVFSAGLVIVLAGYLMTLKGDRQ
jgi:tryptophan-rich sensory protein